MELFCEKIWESISMQLLQLPPHHLPHADGAPISDQLDEVNAGGVLRQVDLRRLQRRAMARLYG